MAPRLAGVRLGEESEHHTFTVIAKAHLGLAKANGVLPGADAIKLFEFGLFDILQCAARLVKVEAIGARERCRRGKSFLQRGASPTWLGK